MFALLSFPIFVWAAFKSARPIENIRTLSFGAALMLTLHLAFFAFWFWVLSDKSVIDLEPFTSMIDVSLNWLIPSGVVAVLLIFVLAASRAKMFLVLPGVLTFLFVAAVFVGFAGHWYYSEFHRHISAFVWWL